jgi:chromosome segregation ATPase
MRTPSPLIPAVLCLVLLASACGDDTDPRVDELASEVAAGAEREAELRSRVEQLEGLIAEDADGEDPLAPVREQLSELRTEVDALTGTLADGEAERSDAVESLAGDIVRLDQRLGELQGSLTGIGEDIGLLTDEVSSLETQLRTHREQSDAHGGG